MDETPDVSGVYRRNTNQLYDMGNIRIGQMRVKPSQIYYYKGDRPDSFVPFMVVISVEPMKVRFAPHEIQPYGEIVVYTSPSRFLSMIGDNYKLSEVDQVTEIMEAYE